ncbi:hypothetical protein OFAG_01088 [Oxalobacter formigenes HOxBLS]|uniref:Uncharacterized protein n=1 Tax=Oxalobacter paraformigenes TaxID=556268 RepID=C3X3Z9_9BURK|nr:hypothetical protein OFAG_01088 [Oxalobacter paraformigenes]
MFFPVSGPFRDTLNLSRHGDTPPERETRFFRKRHARGKKGPPEPPCPTPVRKGEWPAGFRHTLSCPVSGLSGIAAVKQGGAGNRMDKKGQKGLQTRMNPRFAGFAKPLDFRTVRVKSRGKTAGKRREIPLWIGKKSLVTWLKNRLQTIQEAFLSGRVSENTVRKSSPVYPETRPAVCFPPAHARSPSLSGQNRVFPGSRKNGKPGTEKPFA